MAYPLRALADPSADSVRTIRAFHGSPYDFDRFDASKIGTGQSAQAYGYGHYLAQNENVADFYRRTVSALKRTPLEDARELWRKHYDISGNPQKAILDALDHADESLAEAAGIPGAEQSWKEIIQHLYELDHRQPIPKRPGHMYEVEVDHPEASLLDWDRPVGKAVIERLPAGMSDAVAAEAQRMLDMGQTHRHASNLRGIQDDASLAPGQLVYRAAGRFVPKEQAPGWGSVLNTINDSITDQARASAVLNDAGIPGIRYADQSGPGEWSRNYVIFPGAEDRIRILRKYGLLAPMAAGMEQE